MRPAEIICPNCGWHNEPSAMVCGFCGRPLHTASLVSSRSTVDLEDTIPDIPAVGPRTAPAPVAAHPAPGSVPRRRIRRLLTGCLVTLAVLLVIFIGLWAVIIRPVAHTIVDNELRTALEAAASQAPVYTPSTVKVSEAQVNQRLAGHDSGRIPIRQITAQFRSGNVGVIYSLPITGGSITTHLVARDGRLVAQNTHVEGLAGWLETGDELQVSLNDALALLPSDDHFGSVTAQDGTLSVTIVK